MDKIQKLTIFILAISIHLANSQSITPSLLACTGNTQATDGYTISYTVGELTVVSLNSKGYYLTQGFQQSYPESITPPVPLNLISVTPNPFRDHLNINFFIAEPYDFGIEIYNSCGRKNYIADFPDVIYSQRESLNLEFLPKGLYFIHIYSINGKISKVFKIEKMY